MRGAFKMDKIYKDAVGLDLRVDVGRDVTGATDLQLFVMKPDGTEVVWAATLVDLQFLEHTTTTGDIDQAGRYRIQSHMTFMGWTGEGESFELFIYDSYQ